MGLISVNSNVQVPSPAPCDVSGPRWQASRDIAAFRAFFEDHFGVGVCPPIRDSGIVLRRGVSAKGDLMRRVSRKTEWRLPRGLSFALVEKGEHRVFCLYERRRVRIVCEDRQDESPT
jgi:hypothetical protein